MARLQVVEPPYMPGKKLRLGMWTRQSQWRGQRRSQDFQERDNRAFAEAAGHDIVAIWDEKNISGFRPKRKHLEEILRLLDAGEIDGVIVAYASRFARSFAAAQEFIKEMLVERRGVVVCVKERIYVHEGADAETWSRWNAALAAAEEEWRRSQEDWQRVQDAAMEDRIPPQQVPYGYRRDEESGRFVIHEDEARWVRFAFERAGEGWSHRRLARHLNEHGAPLSRRRKVDKGDKSWTHASVGHMLRRQTYLGMIVRKGYEPELNAHPAIVTQDQFDAAQLAETRPSEVRGFLLSGVLRCAECRYTMEARGVKKSYGEYVTYRCRRCGHSISNLAMDPIVRRELLRVANEAPGVFVAAQRDRKVQAARAARDAARRDYLEHRGNERLKKIDGDMWLDELETKKAALDAGEADLSVALKAAHAAYDGGDQTFVVPADPAKLRLLVTRTWPMIFLRREGEDLAERVRFIRHEDERPDVPVRGRNFDARPFRWDEAPLGTRVLLGEDLAEGSA